MKTFELKGTLRKDLGKKATREMRKQNLVPCVIYGSEKDENGNVTATHFQVTAPSLRKLIYTPDIHVVALDIDGQTCNAIMKEVQFHPVQEQILHIDFLKIDEEKPIVMEVPVVLEGLAPGVQAGGKLHQQMRKLKLKAIYTAIPERLVINISTLGLGKSIKVGDLHYEGLEMVSPKQAVVCSVKTTRAAMANAAEAAE